MNITRISIYRKSLSYEDGALAWGPGNLIESSPSTILVVDTYMDAYLSGVGEFCACGENYMVAHSEGTEAAVRLANDSCSPGPNCKTPVSGFPKVAETLVTSKIKQDAPSTYWFRARCSFRTTR